MGLLKRLLLMAIQWTMTLCMFIVVMVGLLWRRLKHGKELFHVKSRPTPPAILHDAKWGTHAYMTLKNQGIKLHYVEAGDHSKPLMVFLHGFPECWFSWRHQLLHFSQKYWVVAVDMRGYGDSDKPVGGKHYKRATLIEDLRSFVQGLGKEQCVLVAHDWGGALAWELVSRYPQMFVAHVSVNGPHKGAMMKHLQSSISQFLKSYYMYFFQLPYLPELVLRTQDLKSIEAMFRGPKKNTEAFPDDVIEAYKYYFSQKDAFTPPLNYYRQSFYSMESEPTARVRVPSLIIWGVEDEALDQDIAILSAAECETSHVKFVKEASHWVQQEHPEVVNEHMQNFLDQYIS